MPFNPTLPVNGSLISSGELRAQLVALHGDIQTRVTQAALNDALLGTSANTNSVGTLGMSISDPPHNGKCRRSKTNSTNSSASCVGNPSGKQPAVNESHLAKAGWLFSFLPLMLQE